MRSGAFLFAGHEGLWRDNWATFLFSGALMLGKLVSGALSLIGAIVVVTILAGMLVFMVGTGHKASMGEAPSSDSVPIPSVDQNQRVPTMNVSAVRLDAEYGANEVAADQRYAGQILRVSGLVASIDKGPLGAVHIVMGGAPDGLFNSGSPFGVDATMNPGNEAIAAHLLRWEPVVMICGKVQRVMGSVMLGDCDFDLTPPRPQPAHEEQAIPIPQRGELPSASQDSSGSEQPDVIPAKVVKSVPFSYPDDAKQAGISGVVTVAFTVAVDGTPQDIHVAQSVSPELDQIAVTALGQFRFQPAVDRATGASVPSSCTFEFKFQ